MRTARPALTLLAALLALIAATEAHAYIIGARGVFRRFAEKQALDRVPAGTLVGRATLLDPAGTGTREAPVRVDVSFPGVCKSQIELPEGTAQVQLEGGKVSASGQSLPALSVLVQLGCPLATTENVPAGDAETQLARLAGQLGVDSGTVSLSRLGRRVAYVVGARPRDLARPQLWFDKETNRPLRVIAKAGGKLWDVRFEDPASPATGRRAPRIAEVWQGGARQLSMHLMAADVENIQKDAGGATSGEAPEDDQE